MRLGTADPRHVENEMSYVCIVIIFYRSQVTKRLATYCLERWRVELDSTEVFCVQVGSKYGYPTDTNTKIQIDRGHRDAHSWHMRHAPRARPPWPHTRALLARHVQDMQACMGVVVGPPRSDG